MQEEEKKIEEMKIEEVPVEDEQEDVIDVREEAV